MKLRTFIRLHISILCVCFAIPLTGQVTIGTDESAVAGALLQLKNIQVPSGQGGVNATKGLLLPRVTLKFIDSLTMGDNQISKANDLWEKHIGLTVYSISDNCSTNEYYLFPGVYTWNGRAWRPLWETDKAKRTDVRNIIDHGTKVVDGRTVGSFTMTYNDGINPAEHETYAYADFGNAGVWMTENLRTHYSPNGLKIPITASTNYSGHTSDGKKIYTLGYPNYGDQTANPPINDKGNAKDSTKVYHVHRQKYGLLYDWYTATNHYNCSKSNQKQADVAGKPIGKDEVEVRAEEGYIKGICPDGWHLPSDREWNMLEQHLVENARGVTRKSSPTPNGIWSPIWDVTEQWRGKINALVMKSVTEVSNSVYPLTTANSKTAETGGFDIYLVGFAVSGTSQYYGHAANFWTSSSVDRNQSWSRHLDYRKEYIGSNRKNYPRNELFSLRCKKNEK